MLGERAGGVYLGGVQGRIGVSVVKIHCVHVWHSQRTNTDIMLRI